MCPLTADKVENKVVLSIEKEMPASEAEKIAKFNEAIKPVIDGIEGVTNKVVAKLGPGDPYDTIKDVVHINEDGVKDLVHDGKVWLVDFWATWCPPCQAPMAHNQQMLEKRGDEWNDVKIIGISIDQGKEAVVKHVEAKKWEKVDHYHRAGSNCSKQYGVNGVPHVMLVDKQGKIVFVGHPAHRDLEKDIDALRAGETLTGQGTGATKPAEEGEKEAEGKEGDPVRINEEIDTFMKTAEEMQKNEDIKTHAKACPRCFCVMTFSQKFNPVTKKTLCDFKNYRVLVGK